MLRINSQIACCDIYVAVPQNLRYIVQRGSLFQQILCGEPHKIANEDGKLDGLPLNRALRDADGDIYDIVAGNFFIVGLGQNDFTDLPHELAEQFAERFRQPEMFMRVDDKIVAAPMLDEQAQSGMSY